MSRTVQVGILVVLAAVVGWAALFGGGGTDASQDLAERIACPVCDGESVAASQTDVARSMQARIDTLLADGYSSAEVLDWFEARYGPEIVLEPPRDVTGLALWAVPIVTILAGVATALRLRRERATDDSVESPTGTDTRIRSVATLVGVAVVLVAAAFALGSYLEPRAEGTPVSGDLVAPTDLEAISDETLAATIASFAASGDVPAEQLNGMRLALAERYFEAGDYRSATSVFQEVLEAGATGTQRSEALGRLGWILWVNDEPEAAEAAFTEAIEAQPANGEARYLFAIVLMAQARADEAAPLLEALLDDPSVPADLLPEIEAMLAEARA